MTLKAMPQTRSILLGALVATALTLSGACSAYAFGEPPSTQAPPAKVQKAQPKKPKCPKTESYNSKTRKCETRKSEAPSDDELYAQGFKLAKAKRYEEALNTFQSIKNQNQPRVLNYIGYTTRKLGRVDEGIGYYLKALALNPNYVEAREYLGEGYLQKGDRAKAEEQLAAIEKICGKKCEQYRELSGAIAHDRPHAQTGSK